MAHHFEPHVAQIFGVEGAIILQNLFYWVQLNKANRMNFHDGYYWTYNSIKAFEDLYPYLSRHKINKALDKLEEGGAIKKGRYNTAPYDRTLWYTITDKWYEYFEHSITKKSEMGYQNNGNGIPKNRKPIPDINTDRNTDKSNNTPLPPKGKSSPYLSMTEAKEIIAETKFGEKVKTTLTEFVEQRQESKHKMTKRALTMMINRLTTHWTNDEDRVDSLEKAIISGWRDVYPEKNGQPFHDPLAGLTPEEAIKKMGL